MFLFKWNTAIFSCCWCKNTASVISSRGSFFKFNFLHLEPGIYPFSGLVKTTCVPPASLPSPPALKIVWLFTTDSKSQLQSTDLLPFFDKARRCNSTFSSVTFYFCTFSDVNGYSDSTGGEITSMSYAAAGSMAPLNSTILLITSSIYYSMSSSSTTTSNMYQYHHKIHKPPHTSLCFN